MVDFLLEVGVEELPADFVESAISQWEGRISQDLTTVFLNPQTIDIYATPRRLALVIKGLPARQSDRDEEVKGPPKKAAYKDGQPTKAAEGFARKQGVGLEDLELRDTPKGEFVFIQKTIAGRAIEDILQELIPQWILGLEGRRFMRWGDGDLKFPRPIRWLVTLLDEKILPFELVNGSETIKSDRLSRGHRVLHPQEITIKDPDSYTESLRSAFVEVDPAVRKEKILAQIETVTKDYQGQAEIFPDLLAEVINLVEYPTAVVGKFEESFLELPTEVISTVMVTHQRYFPIIKAASQKTNLLPNFITISNGDPAKSELIAEGNGRVIRARLADAQFFYKADCDQSLEAYLPQLETVTFQEELGTMRDKVSRIMELAEAIAKQLNLNQKQQEEIESTAMLCKADLVTQMVYEFPELQGIMGEKYAALSGESATVAKGIVEHYLPKGANDKLPQTLNGQVVGIADRLDTLVSIFGLGMIPSGSSDPFALRRAANGIVNITWHSDLEIDLLDLLNQVVASFLDNHDGKDSPQQALEEFFMQRIRTLLLEEKNLDYDLVNAVLGNQDAEYTQRALTNLLDVRDRAQFLQSIRQSKVLEVIYEVVNRATKLAAKGDLATTELDPQTVINPELFESPTEQKFYDALTKLVPETQAAIASRNYQLLVAGLEKVAPQVNQFFDGEDSVLVMAENPEVKKNRLNLLGVLRNHARVLADFGAIVK